MATSTFRRCLWLVNTIREFGPITFEEISRRWESSSLNDEGDPLPKKTFHNHCEAVAEMFDLVIACQRKGGYRYYLDTDSHPDKWIANFLNSLFLQSAINTEPDLRSRIIDYDTTYTDTPSLALVFDAIKGRKPIKFHLFENFEKVRQARAEGNSHIKELVSLYSPDGSIKPEDIPANDINRDFEYFYPMYLICAENTWYVVGMFTNYPTRQITTYELVTMHDVQIMKDAERVDPPADFDIEEYIEHCTDGEPYKTVGRYHSELLDDAEESLDASVKWLAIVREMRRSNNKL